LPVRLPSCLAQLLCSGGRRRGSTRASTNRHHQCSSTADGDVELGGSSPSRSRARVIQFKRSTQRLVGRSRRRHHGGHLGVGQESPGFNASHRSADGTCIETSPSPPGGSLTGAHPCALREGPLGPRPPALVLLDDSEETVAAELGADAPDAKGDAALPPVQERFYSYASLNEHMLAHSLRRSLKRKDWRNACNIFVGWMINWALLLGLMGVFSVYGCEFYSIYLEATNGEMLLFSWAFSVCMRFLINEPFLICASKGVPMLFASAFCANLCGETIATCLGLMVEGVVAFVRAFASI